MRTTITKIILLFLVVLASACNKDEDTTIIIEDGQPKAAALIIGKWKPSKTQLIDKLTGRVIKEEPWDEDESSVWEFFENGTFGKGNTSDRPSWNVDEDDYTISFGGEQWSIGALTKARMILYLLRKGASGADADNILAYFFDRQGAFDDKGDDENEKPVANSKIVRITATTINKYSANEKIETYTFSYDTQGRIETYRIEGAGEPFRYSYEPGKVIVTGGRSYEGLLNAENCINTLQAKIVGTGVPVIYASAFYNTKGYLSMINNTKLIYDKEYNLKSVAGIEYQYTREKNDANIDLNCLISDCSTVYEYGYSHYSLFAPFGFYGKSSPYLVAEEHKEHSDFHNTYDYQRDKAGRIHKIVRKEINTYEPDYIITTTFDIIYQN